MINKEEQVEIFENEEIIKFTDDEGNEYSYVQVACVEHDSEFFVLLESTDAGEDEDDGLFVFRIANYENADEDWILEPVMDEELANTVFDKFIEVYDAEDCGGNCSGCSRDCADRE